MKIEDSLSDPMDLTIGVPQGSVWGPRLSLFMCAPLVPGGKGRHSRDMYANDTQPYRRFSQRDPRDLWREVQRLEMTTDGLGRWVGANKLKLNDSKTEFIFIVNSHNQPVVEQAGPVLKAGDAIIKPTMIVRNLGAHFDRCGSMAPFVNRTVRTMLCS